MIEEKILRRASIKRHHEKRETKGRNTRAEGTKLLKTGISRRRFPRLLRNFPFVSPKAKIAFNCAESDLDARGCESSLDDRSVIKTRYSYLVIVSKGFRNKIQSFQDFNSQTLIHQGRLCTV